MNWLRSNPPCVITVRGRQEALKWAGESGIVVLLFLGVCADRPTKNPDRAGQGSEEPRDLLAVFNVAASRSASNHHDVIRRTARGGACQASAVALAGADRLAFNPQTTSFPRRREPGG
jgi:hypothetical protein